MTTYLPADYHMHSDHSGDSSTPMEDMIKSSIEKGLSEICFTEHMDMDFPILEDVPKDKFTLDIPSYKEELFALRDKYKDKITVRYGIELGLQPQIVDINNKIIKENDFDFCIGSVHLVDKMDPYYPSCWEGKNEEDVIRRYFELTQENISLFSDFDVLGHLDYIIRYTPSHGAGYSYAKYKDYIDKVLKVLVQKKKGLDINTQSMFRGGSFTNPNSDIIKRFKELGGEIITFGSDAHITEAVAGCFEKAKEIAKDCGFDSFYTFEKRVPTRHQL